MQRTMMKSKLHRARVTDANLHYVGSITIDEDLMELVDILPNEKVCVVNNNNGERFETYAIPGVRGSGEICLNGAAARLVHRGDIVIIITYGVYTEDELINYAPKIAVLNERNQIVELIDKESNH